MRTKAFAIGAAGLLAAGAFGIVGGVHHTSVLAACTGTMSPPLGTGVELDAPNNIGCLQVGVSTSNGVVYNPVGGQATGGVPGAYVILQGGSGALVPQGQGYIGVSNYETNGASGATPETNDSPCSPQPTDTDSSGSNGGGTVAVGEAGCTAGLEQDNGEIVVAGNHTGVFLLAPVACGHVSGDDWANTDRDGCEEP